MQLLLIQPDVVWEDRAANIDHIERLLEENPPVPGSLVVLPEMFSVGYSMNVDRIAEDEDGPTDRFLHRMANAYDACVLGGVPHRRAGGKGSNDAVAVAPGDEVLARYTKLHPFSYAGETAHYEPGGDVAVFEWNGVSISPFVCYDLRFPEIYRVACRLGAEVLVTIANFPSPRVDHWVSLLKARAIENQAFVVGVNRCGADPKVDYPGRSMVFDPRGRILAEAGAREEVLGLELSVDELRAYRREFPVLQDLREDFVPVKQSVR